MVSKREFQQEVKSNPKKFWEAIKDSTDLFPKIFPEQYKSMDIVEGDGKCVGSVHLVKYSEGMPTVTFSKVKIEAVDEENKSISYRVIDGEVMNLYKIFNKTIKIFPKEEGSLVNFTLEYEKASEEAWAPELIEEAMMKIFTGLDAFLLEN